MQRVEPTLACHSCGHVLLSASRTCPECGRDPSSSIGRDGFASLWTVGAVMGSVAFAGAVFMAWADGDHLLHSDDPYLAAFFLSLVAGGAAAVFQVARHVRSLARHRHWITIAFVAAWSAMWWAFSSVVGPEASDPMRTIAVASLVPGIAAWALSVLRLPQWLNAALASLALLTVAGYGWVLFMRMNS